MAAKVESGGNDAKKVTAAMSALGKQVSGLENLLSDIKKLQAQISKKPEECAKPAQQLIAELTEFSKNARELDAIGKDLKSSVTK